jgi:hypothetical protein
LLQHPRRQSCFSHPKIVSPVSDLTAAFPEFIIEPGENARAAAVEIRRRP